MNKKVALYSLENSGENEPLLLQDGCIAQYVPLQFIVDQWVIEDCSLSLKPGDVITMKDLEDEKEYLLEYDGDSSIGSVFSCLSD